MAPIDRFAKRRQKLRRKLDSLKLSALLVTGERNVAWLTGFSGDSTWLLISDSEELLLSDFRFVTQLQEECPGVAALIRPSSLTLGAAAAEQAAKWKLRQLAIEGHLLPVTAFNSLAAALPNVELSAASMVVESLRAVKDAAEIEEIRTAVHIAERGLEYLKAVVTPDATEGRLADDMEHQVRRLGAQGFAFPAILAVGDRAALPHYRAADRTIRQSPILLVDWGVTMPSGYRSDLTRTVLTGKPDKKFEKVYRTVLEAQALAIARIAPGVPCKEVDAAARDFIAAQGYGKYFDHGLGHGIGLDVHEQPRFSRNSTDILEPGMVVTVEPGIYLPGWGGVRIEDDVLVTKTGCEVLSSLPKEWDAVRWS